MKKFSKLTLQQLKSYVYALIDPTNSSIFYVGKASANNRAWDHLHAAPNEHKKSLRIEEIRRLGLEPKVDILRYGLSDQEAFEVEAAIIDTLGFEDLTNQVRGHGIERGRTTPRELERRYGAKPFELNNYSEPVILFFISKTYSPTLDHIELYDSVRQFWKVGSFARTIDPSTGKLPYKWAVGVVDSVAVAVYSIEAWMPAHSTVSTRDGNNAEGKWEFVGQEQIDHELQGRLLTLQGNRITATQIGFTYINPV